MLANLALWSLLALGPGDASEPDGFRWPKMEDFKTEEPRQDLDRGLVDTGRGGRGATQITVEASLHGRFAMPFGTANSDVFVYGNTFFVDNHISWSEFFDPGWGATLTIDVGQRSLKRSIHGEAGFEIGGYLSFQQMLFHGENVHDDFGNSVRAGDLDVTAYMVGVKASQPLGDGFYADGRFGMGAIHYAEVMGDFRGPLFPEAHDVLFEETWTFATELLGHVGVRLGPLGLNIGMGFNFWVPPSEGRLIDLDSGAIWTWFLEIGAELGF